VRGVTDALLTELGLDRVGVCLLSIPETKTGQVCPSKVTLQV
jgi:hypothetical protein